MQVACPGCGHVMAVPPERAAVPNLKVRCRCGTVFPVAGAGAASSAVMMSTGSEAPARAPAPPPPAGAPLRTAAAPARLAPAVTAAAPPAAAPAPGAVRARSGSVPVPWRRCQNHPQIRSEHFCPQCTKGFCGPCVKKVQNAALCPVCEGLCIDAAAHEEMQEKERQRARPMSEELSLILSYPLRDRTAYVMLAVFTWLLGNFAGIYGLILANGILTGYSFNAVSKVSIGNLRDVMPEFRDLSDILQNLWLSLGALVVSAGPLLLCLFLIPGALLLMRGPSRAEASPWAAVVHAQTPSAGGGTDGAAAEKEDEPTETFEADRQGSSLVAPVAMLGIVLAFLWMVVYLPVALTVAALSKSFVSTVNPVIGVDTIRKMGGTYWQALAIYAVLVVGEAIVGFPFRFVPFVGALVRSFLEAYVALAVGCTLGLAVFKKAAELGWD